MSINQLVLKHGTVMRRKQKGIDMDLPLNFQRKWAGRMPDVTKMIQHCMTLKLIAEHYGCSATNISTALEAHGTPISRIKHDYRQAFMKELKEPSE